ncbi:unnamed protein product [Urochloa humidicola]
METESRQTKISEKRKRKRLPAGTGTSSIHDLNDDLLELVILGLDSPKCLIRAAATCKHWRRIVTNTGGAFVHRFAIGTFYSINLDTPCSYGRFHVWPNADPCSFPHQNLNLMDKVGFYSRSISCRAPASRVSSSTAVVAFSSSSRRRTAVTAVSLPVGAATT